MNVTNFSFVQNNSIIVKTIIIDSKKIISERLFPFIFAFLFTQSIINIIHFFKYKEVSLLDIFNNFICSLFFILIFDKYIFLINIFLNSIVITIKFSEYIDFICRHNIDK